MAIEIPAGAFAIKDCGCVVIAEWFFRPDGQHEPESGKRWRKFQAKAKRCGYAIEAFQEKPTRDWLCVPHRAANEAYKEAYKKAKEAEALGGIDGS